MIKTCSFSSSIDNNILDECSKYMKKVNVKTHDISVVLRVEQKEVERDHFGAAFLQEVREALKKS